MKNVKNPLKISLLITKLSIPKLIYVKYVIRDRSLITGEGGGGLVEIKN